MKKSLLFSLIGAFVSLAATGQTTYLPLRTEEYNLLDRLETKGGMLTNDFYSTLKPIPRKGAVAFLKEITKPMPGGQGIDLSDIDYDNIQRALSISGEWSETADGDDGALPSVRPVLKYFYQKQPDLVHVNTGDFFLVVNPVLYLQATKERNVDGLKYINTRGAEIRGRIFNKIGFYTMVADNQEKALSYIEQWEARHQAFPGADYYTRNSSGAYDYLLARGYIDVGAFNDHFNVTFGYDKQFTGDGIRSLELSDFGAPATFLRLRTKIWRLQYENLFLELTPAYVRAGDQRLPRKYASVHQVSMNVTPWLNLGLFESTIYAKPERFGAEYLIPVIFYNSVARALGADQKTSLGISFKAIALKHLQFYGQGYFDQLQPGKLGKGWWGNQFGVQLGAKYFDAFTLRNLDLQGEVNIVRPFMYAANDGVSDYTHYNQPLAHPYGAGFAEIIGTVRYQPIVNLYLSAKGIYSTRGTGIPGMLNAGNDIFARYDTRGADEGYGLIGDQKLNGTYFNFNAAYEIRPNIFLEAGATYLDRNIGGGLTNYPASTSFYGGLRWNITRREPDFF
ncbi:hypothetical protein [Taibaiella koreensis]|uniref:hypothetical protein n=1 Tax=Taibaiella koreensis TaxID=1268548 RepID=UPI0013C3337B|nr:hypothetical protein [Taibaiella koreensis]